MKKPGLKVFFLIIGCAILLALVSVFVIFSKKESDPESEIPNVTNVGYQDSLAIMYSHHENLNLMVPVTSDTGYKVRTGNIVGVEITDCSILGYTVTVEVDDTSDIAFVSFPTWTEKNGTDDRPANGKKDSSCFGMRKENVYTYRVNIKEHNNEAGAYRTEVYVYSEEGRLLDKWQPEAPIQVPEMKASITDVQISSVNVDGYTLSVTLDDMTAVSEVKFPTWNQTSGAFVPEWGTSDYLDGKIDGNVVTYRVNVSDFSYQSGDYTSHIYVYDKLGRILDDKEISNIDVPAVTAEFVSAAVSDISVYGYTVTAVLDDTSHLSKVMFPSWTLTNGTDDLDQDWSTSYDYRGNISENTVTFRVKTADHGWEGGTYQTDIYAYDLAGNVVAKTSVSAENVPAAVFPKIQNIEVSNITANGYDVSAEISESNVKWSAILKTWTSYNGQDDLVNGTVTIDGNKISCRIYKSKHNEEYGSYESELVLYDRDGAVITRKSVKAMVPDYTIEDRKAEAERMAQRIIDQYTNSTMSQLEKLKACCQYLVSNVSYTYVQGNAMKQRGYDPRYCALDNGWQYYQCINTINTGGGICFGYASALAACAHQLGYSPFIVIGQCAAVDNPAVYVDHAWVEITIDGTPYYFDACSAVHYGIDKAFYVPTDTKLGYGRGEYQSYKAEKKVTW